MTKMSTEQRDAAIQAAVFGADGITRADLCAMFAMTPDAMEAVLFRLSRAGRIECGCVQGHDWRWGKPGIRARLSLASAERRRLKDLAVKRAARELRAARLRGEVTPATPNALRKRAARSAEIAAQDAELDAWARESIRRIVPATDAEPIRPERPMSIFSMGTV